MRKSSLNALFSRTRQGVLCALVLQPEKWLYLSDLAKFLNVSPSSIQREVASLAKANLLQVRKEGNRIYYKVNPFWPGMHELQGLLIKTAGVADVVYDILKNFKSEIGIAFIYGSFARNEEIASSDIDLMLIGSIKLFDLSPLLKKAEHLLSREINPSIFTTKEFATHIKKSDSFLGTVLNDQKIFLIGTADELKLLVR